MNDPKRMTISIYHNYGYQVTFHNVTAASAVALIIAIELRHDWRDYAAGKTYIIGNTELICSEIDRDFDIIEFEVKLKSA